MQKMAGNSPPVFKSARVSFVSVLEVAIKADVKSSSEHVSGDAKDIGNGALLLILGILVSHPI